MTTSLKNMTKAQLEEYGRELGIELDKRLKKSAIVSQIEEFLDAPQTIESITTRPDRVHPVEETTDVQDIIDSLPKYEGNPGLMSGAIMSLLGKLAGFGKVKFGPDGDGYSITVGKKTYKL